MAVTASGLYFLTFEKMLNNGAAIDLEAETGKVAMFTNSITPNFDTDTAYGSAPYNANEVSGAGYSTGGVALTGTEITVSSGTLVYDAGDTSWASSTIGSARCALYYANPAGGKEAVVLVNFTSDYSTTNGTFTIQWNASGIFTIDLTP